MEIVEVVEAEEEELAETPAVAQAEAAAKLVEEGLVDLGRATAEDLEGTAMLEARAVDRAGELEGAATVEVVAENSSSLRMRDDEKALDLYYLSTLLSPPPPPLFKTNKLKLKLTQLPRRLVFAYSYRQNVHRFYRVPLYCSTPCAD